MRRSLRMNLLIVALIALSVGLGVFAAVQTRSDSAAFTSPGVYGDSEFLVELTNQENSDEIAAQLERNGISVAQVDQTPVWTILADVDPSNVYAFDADLDQSVEFGLLQLDGRKPEVVGEVVLSQELAASGDLEIGDTTASVSGEEVTVVGLLEDPNPFFNNIVYLPEGSLADERAALVEVGGREQFRSTRLATKGASRSELREVLLETAGIEQPIFGGPEAGPSFSIGTQEEYTGVPSDSGIRAETIGAIVSSVMLFQTGLISAVAFMVGMRRRTLDIGRLSAIGAEPAQLRRMLAVEAALLGLVGALVGIAGGLSIAYLVFDILEIGGVHARLEWTVADIAWPGALAVLAAVVAMWFPARWAANLTPEQARSGGFERLTVPRSLLFLSGLALAFGLLLLFLSSNSSDFRWDTTLDIALMGLSGILIILGASGLVYMVMRWFYNGSFRLPLSLRMSARDALRSPVRSVGAVAAYMVLLTFVVASFSTEVDFNNGETDLSREFSQVFETESRSLAVFGAQNSQGSGWVDLANPSQRVTLKEPDIDVDAAVTVQRLQLTFHVEPEDPRSTSNGGVIYAAAGSASPVLVATPELLGRFEISEEARQAMTSGSEMVLISPTVDGNASYEVVVSEPNGPSVNLTMPTKSGDLFEGAAIVLVSPDLVEENGWSSSELTLIFREGGFNDDELRELENTGYQIYSQPEGQGFIAADLQFLLVVFAVVLIICRILSALAGIDSASELASVMAIGAPARFRRTQLAWQTSYGVALAVVAAVPLGMTVAAVYSAGSPYDVFVLGPPWTILGGLILLPVIAAGLIFLTTRSAKPTVSHRLV